MAEKKASLLLELKDRASQGLKKVNGGLKTIRVSWLAGAAAIGAFVVAGKKAVEAFIKQENAVEKLNQSLKAQGIFTEDASKEIQDYASELQKVTTVGDEVILEQQALLTSFGATGDVLKDATKAALDLSAGLGIDLKASTLLLGKALTGETSSLSRYGIKIKEGLKESEKFAAVLEQVNSKFGGSAQSRLNTFSGRIENLGNRFGDLQERLGKLLIPSLERLAGTFNKLVTGAEKFAANLDLITKAENEGLSGREDVIRLLGKQRDELISIQRSTRDLTAEEERRLEVINQAIIREGQALALTKQAEEEKLQLKLESREQLGVIDEEAFAKKEEQRLKEREDALSDADGFLDTIRDREAKRAGIENTGEKRRVKQLAERLKASGQTAKAEELLKKSATDLQIQEENRLAEAERLFNENKKRNFQSTLQFISSLAQSKNKTLAAIGKAAAIADATISTFVAANVALKSAAPPFNFILAAAVTAAGFANVAAISGVELQQGGVVLPKQGGVSATIAEAGKAEAVIPLDDEEAGDRLRESGFGGENLTINVGVLVGGEENVKELARLIDSELFDLRRNQESVAFQGLNGGTGI